MTLTGGVPEEPRNKNHAEAMLVVLPSLSNQSVLDRHMPLLREDVRPQLPPSRFFLDSFPVKPAR